MVDNEKKFTFRLPEAVFNSLQQQASENKTTISQIVRDIISEHLQVETIALKLEEIDISRRFRELYAQARITNHALDVLAGYLLAEKYKAWKSDVNQHIDQEVGRRKSEQDKGS